MGIATSPEAKYWRDKRKEALMRKDRAKADRAEMELAAMKGGLISTVEVKAANAAKLQRVEDVLLPGISALAASLTGDCESDEISLRDWTYDRLTELSQDEDASKIEGTT
tara:strand:- start:10990 stop:11319 length:330 start_codon:yes stop_codon:yes gene_type:complete